MDCGSTQLSFIASLLLVLGTASGQSAPEAQAPAPQPSQLVLERATFLRQVLADSQVLTDQYERALAKLETELAAGSDYEEARLVQQRRAELKALYATNGASLAQSLAIPLPVAQARLSGSAEVRGDSLTGWRTGGSYAEWANVRLPPGRYHLELEVNLMDVPAILGGLTPGKAQPLDKVAFDFYEVSLLAGAEENRRSFEFAKSADDTTFTALRIGPVNFNRSTATLRLAAAAGYPGNLVRLRNLRLVPVSDDVIPAAPSLPESSKSLAEARQRLAADLAGVQKPILTEYLTHLRKIASSDPALKPEADAEAKRLLKGLQTGGNDGGSLLRIFATRSGAAGFETVDNAHLVADPANTGDRFMVEHDGERTMVRLMWVTAAPLEDKDPGRKSFAKHFGIEEEDLQGLAHAAQEFTSGYLEGKTLRLLVRASKDKDSPPRALVFLPDVGLYQNALVDQGLAAVDPPPREARLPITEKALLSALLEREQAAKQQRTGAWALAPEDKQ
jgi:hypothetical protein